MTLPDRRGVPTSASDQGEVDAFDDAFELFLNYEQAAGGAIKQVCTDHPSSVLAKTLRGYMMLMLESTALHPKVASLAATTLADADHANDRERLHLDALARWSAGDVRAAGAVWDRLLANHPTDLLALKMHHYTTFWTGRANVLFETTAGVIDGWDRSLAGYDHLLGMHAFSLNETGHYHEALSVATEAVDQNPEDLWSVHAVAHALEMLGDTRAGDELFEVVPESWDGKNPFIGHIWWHGALFAWNGGDYERVLSMYDERVRPASTEFFLDLQNRSSLLRRLDLVGVETGDRWEELSDDAVARTGDHVLAFTDAHCAMTLARTERGAELAAFADSLAAAREATDNTAAGREVVLQLCRGYASQLDGDRAAAADTFASVRNDLATIGGSHAQRDLFDLLLIDEVEAAGDPLFALHLLRARARRWPTSVPTLTRYVDALTAFGDDDGDRAGAELRAAKTKLATLMTTASI